MMPYLFYKKTSSYNRRDRGNKAKVKSEDFQMKRTGPAKFLLNYSVHNLEMRSKVGQIQLDQASGAKLLLV